MSVRESSRAGTFVFRIFNTFIMTVIVIATLYPFWYILVSSFSSISHIIGSQIILWPDGIHLDAYRQIFRNNLIPNAYKITLIVTIGGTTLSMIMTILAAYVLSRKTLPGQKWLTMFAVFTMLFNGGLVPTYLLVNSLKMTNTLWALIFPGALSTYNMVIMRNFFSGIPESLYEAAAIDGISYTRYLTRILLPLSLPSLATITLFYAVSYWNAYFNSVIYIRDSRLWPMQTLLRQVLQTAQMENMMYDDARKSVAPETLKDAMIVITMIPILCVYPFVQKHFVKGVMLGSVKG